MVIDNSGNGNDGILSETIWVQGLSLTPTIINEQPKTIVPKNFALYSNYPKPCNSGTIIRFELPQPVRSNFNIYDVNGRLVKSLLKGRTYVAGSYSVHWDGTDDHGSQVSSGVYFYKLQTDHFCRTNKMIYLKEF